MNPEISTVSPRLRVVQSLKAWIRDGVLAPNEALPAERVLSERLSVSQATVSRALAVLERERVIHTVSNSRFVANRAYGSPVLRQTGLMSNVVAVAAPEKLSPYHHFGGWSDFITVGVMEELQAAGLHALTLNPERLDMDETNRLLADRPMGVIFPEVEGHQSPPYELADRLLAGGVPVVVYAGEDERSRRFDRLYSDHAAGAYLLTQWLLAQGRRRIVQMGLAEDSYWMRQRRDGYVRAMREAGLAPLPSVSMIAPPAMEGLREDDAASFHLHYATGVLAAVIQSPDCPDAIMASSDGFVPGIARAIKVFGKVPNRDIAIVGYDNYWEDSWLHKHEPVPPMATVDKRNVEMGRELVRLFQDRLSGKLPPEPQSRVVEPRMIITSTGQVSA